MIYGITAFAGFEAAAALIGLLAFLALLIGLPLTARYDGGPPPAPWPGRAGCPWC